MAYEAKNYDHLLGIQGLSDTLMKNHFTLYQGYVTNTNKLLDTFGIMLKEGKLGTPEFNELKRRFGWEFNGMRLHEYFFGGMTKKQVALNKDSQLSKSLVSDFGSYENWEKDFKATASMRGVGWTIIYFDPSADKLINIWVNEHDVGHLAGLVPILNIDVFEHAFMIDYGLKRADYIEAFMKLIDWTEISKRFEKAEKH